MHAGPLTLNQAEDDVDKFCPEDLRDGDPVAGGIPDENSAIRPQVDPYSEEEHHAKKSTQRHRQTADDHTSLQQQSVRTVENGRATQASARSTSGSCIVDA